MALFMKMPAASAARIVLVPLLGLLFVSQVYSATPEQVNKAIEDAKAYLYAKQSPKTGTWDTEKPEGNQWGGLTAMATYALLASGESSQDPRIQRAVRFLANAQITGIYALGLRAQVWPLLPPDKDVTVAALRDRDILLKACNEWGRYGYTISRGGEHNSPSQYGVLGVYACAQVAGIEVPQGYWTLVDAGWKECQGPDGGWQYASTKPPPGGASPAFTAAGIATLFITQDFLSAAQGAQCKGNITNGNIEAGLQWMDRNFAAAIGTGEGYVLYGIERIGVSSGYKYFGKNDWYQAGAELLVTKQANGVLPSGHGAIPGTAWGILFLVRGRAPVMMNKLQYEIQSSRSRGEPKIGNWNQRPRDAANIARWIGKEIERPLNWQIVNLKVPADELHDSPILYVCGDEELRFSDEEKRKLKEFIEGGGLVLGQADCGNSRFSNSFKKLGGELFPTGEFRPLTQENIVLNQQFKAAKWKSKIDVLGLSNGVRELMLLIPSEDPARAWQQLSYVTKREEFELAADIFLYAVEGKNLRYKGETYLIKPDEKIAAKRTLKVARIKYDGNWDPEPGGWKRLNAYLHNQHQMDLKVNTVLLREAEIPQGSSKSSSRTSSAAAHKPRSNVAKGRTASTQPAIGTSLEGYAVAHLTGTASFKLGSEAREELKRFVEGGGTLVVDAAGGSPKFAESAEAELGEIFGEPAQLERSLPLNSDLYTLSSSPAPQVGYRAFARQSVRNNPHEPRVRGIRVKDRIGVFYSREDLSCGLVGQPVDGIVGYDPKSATQLMANMILCAAGERGTGVAAPLASTAPSPPTAVNPLTQPAAPTTRSR